MKKYTEFIRIAKAVKKYCSIQFLMQIIFPKTIPVIIVNFNQLKTLKELINFLFDRKFSKIYIIDNHSTYQPLLDYYEEMKKSVEIIMLDKNEGHMVFFKNKNLFNKLAKGFFILTDPDILPNKKLPKNFMRILIKNLMKYDEWVTKAGFALDISDLPDFYPAKEQVIAWEKRFWKNEVEKNIYLTRLDTTFALYKPISFEEYQKNDNHFKALRIAGNFTCEHLGWHIDYSNLTDEQNYYRELASNSSSWIIDSTGKTKDRTY
ncbi:glycosyltransferase family protein [Chryseobacterium chendengshani]|uniref:glycosyltransferase n=1 Tax=unclassified Chryseobacterium TaxID=2593645 RepID=UPI001C640EED|nr:MULTISPECIES: glycosyltransferase [unclassified Chryseobacterium]MBW7675613.1 hypothetical protein [Chryseobacterium sp. LJ756]MBW8521824.1 hypothetical protein [Chryseobacterium sp. LJ668]QYK17484.1 hypothetical protein K0U91_05005 [Chryseobacterium sp. LJ668]